MRYRKLNHEPFIGNALLYNEINNKNYQIYEFFMLKVVASDLSSAKRKAKTIFEIKLGKNCEFIELIDKMNPEPQNYIWY